MFFTYLRRELRRRIIGQVMSEAVALGVVGGAAVPSAEPMNSSSSSVSRICAG